MEIELLPLDQKALQLLFPGYRFASDDVSFAERLTDMGVGGFCLYGGSPQEIADLTSHLQSLAKIPLLFCADYEDGLPSQASGGTAFPSNMGLGASGDERLAYEKGRITALEAKAMGVRWLFAPVLDLATEPANPIVNIRAFGSDPKLVAQMGEAYMKGVAAGGALSCAKHFPGHGETQQDSHLELPVLKASRETLMEREIVPFRKTQEVADSVMVAHLKIPGLDDAARVPASLSKAVIDGLLRREIRYRGLIVIDALSMNAVARHFAEEKACLAALKAGADILLVPADPLKTAESLPALATKPEVKRNVEAAFQRLWKAKESCGLFKDRGMPSKDLSAIGCDAHMSAAEKMAQACLAWARKSYKPLSGRAAYLEIGAASAEEWRGQTFVEELRKVGIDVESHSEQIKLPLIVASFLSPKAYLGKIQWSPQEIRQVQSAIAKSPSASFVSFGSPFVMDQLSDYSAGLCAFSGMGASQKAAALALAGRIPVTGQMPAALKSSRAV